MKATTNGQARLYFIWLLAAALACVGCSADSPKHSQRGSASSPNAPVLIPVGASGRGALASGPGDATRGRVVPTSSTNATSPPGSMSDPVVNGMIDDCGAANPAGLSAEDTQRLMAGGPAAPRLLYPYNETVFPRGMLPPTLMWDGATADSVYVHIQSKHFEWKGCVRPTGANQLELPEVVWRSASASTLGAQDPFKVELTTLSGGTVAGPVAIAIVIAQATLKGSLYYNSYFSAGSFTGSIFRIPAGKKAELFLGGLSCYGCHAVSANGERLIAHNSFDPGETFAVSPMTQPNPPALAGAPLPGFVGLSPDGKYYLTTAHPNGPVRPQGTPNEAALVNDSGLYETDTGAPIAGSGIPAGAMMPTFAPDGKAVTFNDVAIDGGRGLAVMDFDQNARLFSGHRVVYKDTDRYPGWPFFLPDAKAIIFARGINPQFSGSGGGTAPGGMGFPGFPGGAPTPMAGAALPNAGLNPESDLYMVDLASGTTTILARAMGMTSTTDTTGYVPFGAEDLHKHYYPTVTPVSAGGYFWLFFDSVRHYGNLGLQRQLWGAAISISQDGDYSVDRSHPAFYLPGQEFGTGNHRAFAALDACVKDGNSCRTGIDCCGGFCSIAENASTEFGEPTGTCSSTTPECAARDERCVTDADCCPPQPGQAANSCIAGYCAFIDLK